MLGEKALELVKELQRSRCGTLPPFNVSYYTSCVKIKFCAKVLIFGVWPKTRPGPRKRGRLGLDSDPAQPEPGTILV